MFGRFSTTIAHDISLFYFNDFPVNFRMFDRFGIPDMMNRGTAWPL
jgi:hypothetical protein